MSDNLRGAAWMTAAMTGYVVNDALMKWVLEDLPLFQAVLWRGIVIISLLAVLTRVQAAPLERRMFAQRPMLIRASMEATGTVVYLSALARAPLAPLTTMLQLVPIAVTFVAARLLRERVSGVRVAAVAAGFVGVILIMQPWSSDFDPWLFGGLATVVVIVAREVATVSIDDRVPGLAVALTTAIVITLLGAVGSIFQGWESPSGARVAVLIGAATFLSLGYIASVNAVRIGDLSFTAPFRYTIIAQAIVLQIVIFGDVPDALTIVGAVVITGAGLAALGTETRPAATPVGR